MLEKVVRIHIRMRHTMGVSVRLYVSLSKLQARVCCFLHFCLQQIPDTLQIITLSLSELKHCLSGGQRCETTLKCQQFSQRFSCSVCSSLSNICKNVSGKMRNGWKVSSLMLVPDVLLLLADVSVNLLTYTIPH